jgi:alpha-amylase
MGTPEQLRNMINTCRDKGVRVYADAVVNHMVGNGNDMFPNHCSGGNFWGNKNSSGGSPFWSQGFAYQNWTVTNSRPGMEMPAVPYGPNDFHCARSLNSWTDGFILNYGWLVNLADLNTETEYVRQRIADYFTQLLSIGFSGFRIDAAKHISPKNLAAIFAKLKANLGGKLPDDFITYLEVIIGGEKDLLMCQGNDYNFGSSFATFMK